jgi:diguanylate cyclase (GGDEF)-like protein/PAS domain S-box-containing protein
MTTEILNKAATCLGLLDHSPIGHFVVRSDFMVVFWNRCLETWTGIPRGEIVGQSIIDRFPHLGEKKYLNRIKSMFAGGPPTIFSSQLHKFLIPAPLPGGKFRIQYSVVTAVPDPEGGEFYALFSIQDVTSLTEAIEGHQFALQKATEEMDERKKVEAKLVRYTEELKRLNSVLKERSIRDGLTGLFNHRYFYYFLRREFMLSTRSGTDLACLLLDLDNFKKLNDSYGHQFGDTVLKTVAERIRKTVRETDVVSRYGGEEFAILLPGTELEGAVVIAEKIRARIENQAFPHSNLSVGVTVSIGVATGMAHNPSKPQDLLAFADNALYRAKAAGRNCVVVHSAGSDEVLTA